MFKRILVPLDGSALSEAVLIHAQEIARSHNSEICLLRVVVFPAPDTGVTDADLFLRFADDLDLLRADAQSYVDHIAAALRADGFAARADTRDGPVCDAILRHAAAIGADLITMSTHGRSASARWLMGSVADKVVRSSPVPVLLIRPHLDMADVKRRRRRVQAVVTES
ncbi:MAG: universal stress protein [Chloroflexi bacterium]|nr:universal stress protein [Chloroflexota bacterium]